MLLRTLLLLTLAAFVGSSAAFAYPLNDGSGGVVWGFEGMASDGLGGPVHTIAGSLKLGPGGISGAVSLSLTSVLDGTDVLSGVSNPTMRNSLPGVGVDEISGFDLSHARVLAAPSYVSHPTDAYWGQLALGIVLRDVDGVAFEGQSAPFPNIAVLPGYASDIALFEVHQLTIYQALCHDIIGPGNNQSYCSQGGGLQGDFSPTFSITIDRFVDPVPEPAGLGLGALALIALLLRRERDRRQLQG